MDSVCFFQLLCYSSRPCLNVVRCTELSRGQTNIQCEKKKSTFNDATQLRTCTHNPDTVYPFKALASKDQSARLCVVDSCTSCIACKHMRHFNISSHYGGKHDRIRHEILQDFPLMHRLPIERHSRMTSTCSAPIGSGNASACCD